MAKAVKVAKESLGSLGCLGCNDVGSIKGNWSISFSNDIRRASSKLSSLDEVLNEVALGGLVDDFNNGSFFGYVGDLCAIVFASSLDVLTTIFMNCVQLCDVDLATGHIMDELGLRFFVGICDLLVDLLVGVCVDFINGLHLNRFI